MKNYANETKERVSMIRIRTWSLTIVIVIALIFYYLVMLAFQNTMNVVDFILLATLQILVYVIYFPDGDIYGQQDKSFIANRDSYNEKAEEINKNKRINELREYCRIDFEKRKERYVINECGAIGIELSELEILKQKDEKFIKKLKSFEFVYDENGLKKSKLVFFSRHKRKKLYRLIFGKIPVEENTAETIMSAVENNGNHAIRDESLSYKIRSYTKKVLMAVVVGGFFSYIGYTVRDGVSLAEICSMIMALATLIATAVTAFSAGEKSSKLYKNRFYLRLCNFIDEFNEWDAPKQVLENIENLAPNSNETVEVKEIIDTNENV